MAALRRQKQGDQQFKSSLGHIVRYCPRREGEGERERETNTERSVNYTVIGLFGALYSVLWVYMYILMPVPYCSEYCSFVLFLK
jgi:hypothetical protein